MNFVDPRLNHTPAQAGYGEGNPGVRAPVANTLAARNAPMLNSAAAVRPGMTPQRPGQAPIIASGQPVVGGVR